MEPEREILVALRRIIRATDLHSRRLMREIGLTAPQLLVLQTIRETPSASVSDIARLVSLSQATVTSILDRLEVRSLVTRARSEEDKRKVLVNTTREGRQVLKDTPMPLQKRFLNRLERLENWERAMIIASLQRVAHLMDAEGIDASPLLDVGKPDRDRDDL